ncbi:MAG: hypothetical protein RLZZ416_69 [Candidatus Parcubacteria bacterium]|jgi:hypothetical protein
MIGSELTYRGPVSFPGQHREFNSFEQQIAEAWEHDVLAVYVALQAWLASEGKPDLAEEAYGIMKSSRLKNRSPVDVCDEIRELCAKK